MVAGGLPVFSVQLDDGTNTFPHDVTAHVRLEMGWQISRGRQDRFADVQPGTLDIVFDNTSGLFTLGSATYDIAMNQKIRFSLIPGGFSVPVRFTGRVLVWPTDWPDGGQTFAVARVKAVDDSARLERRKLRTIAQEHIQSQQLIGLYYPLNEVAGSTSAAPLVDAHSIGRMVPRGAGPAPVFGIPDRGPRTDTLGVPTFEYGGKYLRAERPIDTTVVGTGKFGCVFEAVSFTASLRDWPLITLYPNSGQGGRIIRISGGIPNTVNLYLDDPAGGSSAVSVTVNGLETGPHWIEADGLDLLVDGVVVGTAAGTFSGTLANEVWLDVGGTVGGVVGDVWSVSHVAVSIGAFAAGGVYDVIKAGGPTGDTSYTRLQRIIEDYVGEIQVASTGTMANTAVPYVDWVGSNAGDAVRAVARAEGGVFFIRGDGQGVIQSRHHRAVQVAPVMSFTVDDVGPDTGTVGDMQGVVNYASYTAVVGGEQVFWDAAAIVTHGQYPDTGSLLVADEDQALAAAHWVVNTSATPVTKLPQVTVDLITQATTFQAAVMALTVGDRVELTGMPSQADAVNYDLVVEGWVESGDHQSWQTVFNLSNWEQARAWILGDAVYGILGTTTRLGY